MDGNQFNAISKQDAVTNLAAKSNVFLEQICICFFPPTRSLLPTAVLATYLDCLPSPLALLEIKSRDAIKLYDDRAAFLASSRHRLLINVADCMHALSRWLVVRVLQV